MILHHSLEAPDLGIRLERWFKRHYSQASFTLIAKLVRLGKIRVNDQKALVSQRLAEGDVITFPNYITAIANSPTREFDITKNPRYKILSEGIKNSILYRDDDLIILNKPSGLAVQGGSKINISLDAMLHLLQMGSSDTPKLVHRLDRETSGALLLGRSANAAALLSKIIHDRLVNKNYLALCQGIPTSMQGIVDQPLYNKEQNKQQTAITHYRVLAHNRSYSLIELRPITGRMHQLRIHTQSMGCPIVGDRKYNLDWSGGKLHLHAWQVSLKLEGRQISVTAPLPQALIAAIAECGFDLPE